VTELAELEQAKTVPMWMACLAAGMDVPRGAGGGHKTHCPFEQFAHPDGGDDPAFRIYGDHAFCFACWQWYSPVTLCAAVWEVPRDLAAARLLDVTGFRPPSWVERFERAAEPDPPDTATLAEALRVFCAGEAGNAWDDIRADSEASSYLATCLGYLNQVTTDAAAVEWLEQAKEVMRIVIEGRRANATH
jgi:hypothetical protein